MKGIFREVIGTVLGAVVIYALLQLSVQTIEVHLGSMEPNIHEGQRIIVSKITYYIGKPQRGDIIVFYPPTNPSVEYIKRVVGLPGEVIEINNGKIFINGKAITEPYIPQEPTYVIEPQTIPAGYYFVLGDNRNSSIDSHAFGPIPRKSLVGKAWLRYYPLTVFGLAPNHSFAR